MLPEQPTLGVIAGEGEFPCLVVAGARSAGMRIVVVGLRGSHDPSLRDAADAYYQSGLLRLGRWIRLFRREHAHRVIMAGRVRKAQMLELPRWRQWLAYLPDWTSIRVWFSVPDRRNDTLLTAVADAMAQKGIQLIDSTTYCPDAMAAEGLLCGRPLSPDQQADADLGWHLAREMGRLDVGQSVAIKDKDVVAVEAIEGTDAMIQRAGALCKGGGWVLVKVAKPRQDMRFDVPTVGPDTIEMLAKHRGKVLVIESGKTLIVNRERTLNLARQHEITIIGRQAPVSRAESS